jgi:hypothetical protein
MAQFKSRFLELGFYVNGQLKNFNGGNYVTEDKSEIEVLSALVDVERVDTPVKEPKKAEEPAATKRKTSEK